METWSSLSLTLLLGGGGDFQPSYRRSALKSTQKHPKNQISILFIKWHAETNSQMVILVNLEWAKVVGRKYALPKFRSWWLSTTTRWCRVKIQEYPQNFQLKCGNYILRSLKCPLEMFDVQYHTFQCNFELSVNFCSILLGIFDICCHKKGNKLFIDEATLPEFMKRKDFSSRRQLRSFQRMMFLIPVFRKGGSLQRMGAWSGHG